MRYFKITYHLSLIAILCMTFTSCIGNALLEEVPNQGSKQSDTRLIFSLNMPEGSGNSTTEGSAYEQHINDMYVYAFDKANGSFIEKVDNLIISGNDGDKTRYIFGILEKDYSTYQKGVEFVLLTNLKEKGVVAPNLTKDDKKTALYEKLSYKYNYTDKYWVFKNETHYIPMWGICTFDKIEPGINEKSISLYRAIAKINITLNDGNGFGHFRMKKVEVCNVNTQGYCAPLHEELTIPSIPSSTGMETSITFNCNSNEETIGGLQDRIYIPEYKNIGVASNIQSSLKIIGTLTTTLGENVEKTYTLPFKKDGKGVSFDILRNNLYIFNITSISKDIEIEHELSYTVEKWEEISIDIPSFN